MEGYKTIEGRATAEIEAKKSRFIGQLAHVDSEEEALAFLEEIKAANRMARHNVYAYIIRAEDGGMPRVRYSDDGEPQKTAGMPTLQVLQGAELTNVVCVVTRYFGGTLLGTGGLVRAYTQATQEAVQAATVAVISSCVDIEVTIPYTLHDQLAHIAAAAGAKTVDTSYTSEVTVRLRMLNGTQEPLLQKLRELCRGQECFSVTEPFDASF